MAKSIRNTLIGIAALCILAVGYYYLIKKPAIKAQSEAEQVLAESQNAQPGDPYSQQLNQLLASVKVKETKLKEVETQNPVLYKKFVSMIQQLTNDYLILEKELEASPNRQQLMEAMLQNLNLQQDLLNQQLSIYQNIKNGRNEDI